jgi:hypothetical protein
MHVVTCDARGHMAEGGGLSGEGARWRRIAPVGAACTSEWRTGTALMHWDRPDAQPVSQARAQTLPEHQLAAGARLQGRSTHALRAQDVPLTHAHDTSAEHT